MLKENRQFGTGWRPLLLQYCYTVIRKSVDLNKDLKQRGHTLKLVELVKSAKLKNPVELRTIEGAFN